MKNKWRIKKMLREWFVEARRLEFLNRFEAAYDIEK